MTTSSPEGRQEAAVLDAKALHAAAQIIDPSGIFGLTWQECMERAEAAIRAYLALTPAKPAVEVVEALKDAMRKAMDIYQADAERDIGEAMFMVLHSALSQNEGDRK